MCEGVSVSVCVGVTVDVYGRECVRERHVWQQWHQQPRVDSSVSVPANS